MNDPVKAKIIELVPEILSVNPTVFKNKVGNWQYSYIDGAGLNQHSEEFGMYSSAFDAMLGSGRLECRSITLADVLRAIEEAQEFFWTRKADEYEIKGGTARVIVEWDLTTDYDGQTQEVKDFIGSLLGL